MHTKPDLRVPFVPGGHWFRLVIAYRYPACRKWFRWNPIARNNRPDSSLMTKGIALELRASTRSTMPAWQLLGSFRIPGINRQTERRAATGGTVGANTI